MDFSLNGKSAVLLTASVLTLGVFLGSRFAEPERLSARSGHAPNAEGAPSPGATSRERQLERQVQALEGRLDQTGAALSKALDESPEARSDNLPSSADERAEAEGPQSDDGELEWVRNRGRFLDDQIQHESRDAEWADEMESMTRQYVESRFPNVSIEGVLCKESLCRMSFRYSDPAERGPHLSDISEAFPEDLPRASYAYPGEPERHDQAVVYLARAGREMPKYVVN
jgi:hypothetical protein